MVGINTVDASTSVKPAVGPLGEKLRSARNRWQTNRRLSGISVKHPVSCKGAGHRVRRGSVVRASESASTGNDQTFKPAPRIQNSLLAPLERKALGWLASHSPSWLKPDHLTALGFGAMFMTGVSYALVRLWAPALLLVNAWIALNWLGDSLDGTLARYRNKQRPRYGFYVDHMSDAFGALFLTAGFALSGLMTPLLAAAVLIAFSLLSIQVYLATYTIGTFRLSFYKFSPTELRVVIALGNVAALFRPVVHTFGSRRLLFDVSAVIAVGLMMILLVVSVARNVAALYRAERV